MKDHENPDTEMGIQEREPTAATAGTGLLPLDLQERVIVLKLRESGAIRRHIFRRITRADVDGYFSALTVATERGSRGSTTFHIDSSTAELKLFETAIVRVEGYALLDGRDLMSLPNWKDRVPGGHQLRSVGTLMRVERSQDGPDLGIDPEAEVVSLDAPWAEGNGGMIQYRGLLHRFSPPKIAHWRELNNASTRSTVIGGSRSQKTLYPKLNGVHTKLYDELILSADGYSIGGRPIGGRDEIIREMDPFHKIAACTILFDRSGAAQEVEELEEA